MTSNHWNLLLFTMMFIGFGYIGEYTPMTISALGAVYTSNKMGKGNV